VLIENRKHLGNPLVLEPRAPSKSVAVHDSHYTLGARNPPTERDDKNGDRAVYFLQWRREKCFISLSEWV